MAEPLREKTLRDEEQRLLERGLIDFASQRKQELAEDWAVTMTAVEPLFQTEHSGKPEAVLTEIEGAKLASLRVAVPRNAFSPPRIVVRFDRDDGCRLTVEGPPQWVRSTHSSLKDLIDQRVPWWAPLRSLPAAWALAHLAVVPVILAYVARADDPSPWAPMAFAVGALLLVPPTYAAVQFSLPGFEVTSEGRGRGGKVMAGVSVLLLFGIEILLAVILSD